MFEGHLIAGSVWVLASRNFGVERLPYRRLFWSRRSLFSERGLDDACRSVLAIGGVVLCAGDVGGGEAARCCEETVAGDGVVGAEVGSRSCWGVKAEMSWVERQPDQDRAVSSGVDDWQRER